jgi:choline dehydrogenase-like flavoprotein
VKTPKTRKRAFPFNARANPVPVQNYGNQAGGGTVHYGTVSWRFHEDDFRARSHTIARYGASAIPADSSLTDWPLSYTDLEPYYDRAEYDLGVSGKAGNVQGAPVKFELAINLLHSFLRWYDIAWPRDHVSTKLKFQPR